MPKIKGLSHVVLYTKDLDKMVAFYRDVLGLVKYREHAGRMVFLTADPDAEDHELALVKGREGEAKIIAHIAWRVETPADVKAYYERFKAQGVPIDHCVSHAYEEMGETRCRAISSIPKATVSKSTPWSPSVTPSASTARSTWTKLLMRSSPRQAGLRQPPATDGTATSELNNPRLEGEGFQFSSARSRQEIFPLHHVFVGLG
ncbi:MAG: VOC family protein [Deltaproteobacteria bacterium]|nr:VOC family protein [Deltaproteobacteria bacterium]